MDYLEYLGRRLVWKVDEFLSAKKNKSRAATATYNHSLNDLKVCQKVT